VNKRLLLILIVGSGVALCAVEPEPLCTYKTWAWNTRTKRSIDHRQVQKNRASLTSTEKDPHSSCTVCEEDQVSVVVEDLPPVQVCRDYAEAVRKTLETIKASGFPITSLTGYRPGLTKGPVDRHGVRTQFSNHSFGTAVDVNAEINGLYTNCYQWGPSCRLLRGGPWRAGRPGTVTRESPPFKAFTSAGWKWGGELEGRQKDFMHFSLSGD